MAETFLNPPTFANPVISDGKGGSVFNPIWLSWFLEIAQYISSSNTGKLKDLIPVTTGGVYTPTDGTNNIIVFAGGAGGGGGSAPITPAGQCGIGGGGGAGALVYGLYTTGFSGAVITIGNGGLSDGPGDDTTFGTLLTAHGGLPGSSILLPALTGFALGGDGGAGTGAFINGYGANGGFGISLGTNAFIGGAGADSMFGQGGQPGIGAAGQAAKGYCAGGSGASIGPSNPAPILGGVGAPGFMLIMEYS